jgi:hypothetical protein
MAERREIKAFSPIGKAIYRMVSKSPGRNESERRGGLENLKTPRPSRQSKGEGSMDRRNSGRCDGTLGRGDSDSTETRTRRATGEALLYPRRNPRSKVDRITGAPGKSVEVKRVAEGYVVARKRGNARGAKGPCCRQFLQNQEGRGEMIKAPSSLQDLRRRIYVKAKTEWTHCESEGSSRGRGGVGEESRKRSQRGGSHNP